MALNKELWIADIQEAIKMDSPFLATVTNHDAYIVNRTVHVPQAGSVIDIQVDRTVLPAGVLQRTDSELTYDIRQFTISPVRITDLETAQISYDKRQSILGEGFRTLAERMGNEALKEYAKGAITKVTTSGTATNTALAEGVSTNRKAVTTADIMKLAQVLDKQGMPKNGRKLIMQTDMFYQLLAQDNMLNSAYNGFANNALETGVVLKLFGFDISIRPFVAVYATDGTPKDFGAAGVGTDNLACIAYHPSAVAKAMGATEMLYDENNPVYYGSILSAIQWAGFSKLRADNKGVVALVQSV
ncbi:hypothetical protein ABID22_000135 [Pontibacter aydingkolensis]|uniref:P22 coat protein-gene protein 5 n=1 Tax=Pontibacter aydingkolensis TaxID=1911536 RepID=A0ABS7CRP8_9BACT|nr:phage capsid protein [Pontibacter aydingkolensis]MBW7466197.1 hypothetical protein [Pontibacter aydingkolensis]